MKVIIKDNRILTIIFTFIAFLVALFLSIQIKTIRVTDVKKIENMRESELKTEISGLESKKAELENKLEELEKNTKEYKKLKNEGSNLEQLLNKDLEILKKQAGYTDLTGEGVNIILEDGKNSYIDSADILFLVTNLWNAGAEGISINNERVVNNTEIVTVENNKIVINGNRVIAPYNIKAIGNSVHLDAAVNSKNGYINEINNNGKKAICERDSNIKIEAYKG